MNERVDFQKLIKEVEEVKEAHDKQVDGDEVGEEEVD